MSYDENIGAELVWDGGDEVRIPARLMPRDGATMRADQMQGSARERLGELAGRCCYDSLGTGRSSTEYHSHILQVQNTSVYEHCAFTLEFRRPRHSGSGPFAQDLCRWLFNRPELYVDVDDEFNCARLTMNIRHALEWCGKKPGYQCDPFYESVLQELAGVAPGIRALHRAAVNSPSNVYVGRVVEPRDDHERWISMFLYGSRGMSHEQVRHGDWTAISQRSTRYVDESESAWVEHPLVSEFRREYPNQAFDHDDNSDDNVADAIDRCREVYRSVTSTLQEYLAHRGVDRVTARKQARGAARGYLGNALYTEMIFSASVAQWRWMLKQRLSAAADAEIRVMYSSVLRELRKSRYAESLSDMETRPSPDGIGEVLA